jgi:hypothetical protein
MKQIECVKCGVVERVSSGEASLCSDCWEAFSCPCCKSTQPRETPVLLPVRSVEAPAIERWEGERRFYCTRCARTALATLAWCWDWDTTDRNMGLMKA